MTGSEMYKKSDNYTFLKLINKNTSKQLEQTNIRLFKTQKKQSPQIYKKNHYNVGEFGHISTMLATIKK